MPEGDTIFRTARTLDRALSGRTVTRFRSDFPQLNRIDEDSPLAGRTISEVVPLGKHLLIRFSGNLTLRTHLRMKGSWHIYRPGETWQRSRHNARIVIETDAYVAVGFSIPVAEMLETDHEGHARELRRLGPDLLGVELDLDEVVDRFRAKGSAIVADTLLNQTVMAGVGNVYKSEVLFLCRVDPRRRVGSLSEEKIRALIERSRELLQRNVAPSSRRTGLRQTTNHLHPGDRLWVYGRADAPCRICGTAISGARIGVDARVTYWCSSCQQG